MKEPQFLEKSAFQTDFENALGYLIGVLNDYQFNREDEENYHGFINIGYGLEGKGKAIENFLFLVENHKLFEPFMEVQGYKFEKVHIDETIIVHINPGVIKKEKYKFSKKFLNQDLEFRDAIDFFDNIENGIMDNIVDRLMDHSDNPFMIGQIFSGFVSLDREFTFEDVKEFIGKEDFYLLIKSKYLEKVEKRSLVS